jgi:hypothetical protein
MRAAKAGAADACMQLMRARMPYVQRVARRPTAFRGREDIHDLLQDALLFVHAVRATCDRIRAFSRGLWRLVGTGLLTLRAVMSVWLGTCHLCQRLFHRVRDR